MDNLPSFLYTLTEDLRENFHASIGLNVSKRTGHVHLTSRIELQNVQAAIFCSVKRTGIAYPVALDFIQQKGYKYNYILFHCFLFFFLSTSYKKYEDSFFNSIWAFIVTN